MRESIEIEKHTTIDQERKPTRQYVARSFYYAKLNFSFFAHARGLIESFSSDYEYDYEYEI